MGVVYEAEQTNPKRRVALKVIRGGQFVDDVSLRMFQRESDTLGRLEHPNIGAIYEAGRTDDGQHFFAMELVRGETLDVHLSSGPERLSAGEIERRLRLFQSIANAVHYAHQRGVIHRDLKPSNVIVTERDQEEGGASGAGLPETKILDFGLARISEGGSAIATTMTEVGMIKGTLPYMSPEQARGSSEDLDLRTDVYALGVILFEMLAGERPYDTGSPSIVEAIRVICETPPTPLRQVWRGERKLDDDLATIVAKALEKEAGQRYDGAGALAEDIERYLTSQPILARPPSTGYQLKKLVERNKLATLFAGTVLALLAGFGVWMSVLWRQSELARTRAEAARILTLGRLEIDESPSSALAFVLASLELDDNPVARRFALEALWRGPTARVLSTVPTLTPAFSPDGRFLAIHRANFAEMRAELVFYREQGGSHTLVTPTTSQSYFLGFDAASRRLFSVVGREALIRSWSVPDFMLQSELGLEGDLGVLQPNQQTLVTFTDPVAGEAVLVHKWDLGVDEPVLLGTLAAEVFSGHMILPSVDPSGRRLAYARDGGIYLQQLEAMETSAPRLIGRHEGGGVVVLFHPVDEVIVSAGGSTGEIRFWSLGSEAPGASATPIRTLEYLPMAARPRFDPTGRYLACGDEASQAWVWDLTAPPDARPLVLKRADQQGVYSVGFHPELPWLMTTDNGGGTLWPLGGSYPLELQSGTSTVTSLVFDPAGRWLASTGSMIEIWPLEGNDMGWTLPESESRSLDVDPEGKLLLVGSTRHGVRLRSLDGGESRLLGASVDEPWTTKLSPDGRYAAVGGGQFVPEEALVRIWDLETGEKMALDAGDGIMISDVLFLRDGRLVASGGGGLRLWTIDNQSFETLWEGPSSYLSASSDHRVLLSIVGEGTHAGQGGTVVIHDLENGTYRELASHGNKVNHVAVDTGGTLVVTGDVDGVVRVSSIAGEKPHLLLGHKGSINAVAFDPKGRWIASGGVDKVIRLWPIPKGEPVHSQPLGEFLDLLRELTNYRVVADSSTADGYRLQVGLFPGWETVPTW